MKIVNRNDCEGLGFSGAKCFDETTSEGIKIYISSGATNSGSRSGIPTFMIDVSFQHERLFELMVYQSTEHDSEYNEINSLVKSFNEDKAHEILVVIERRVFEFIFNYSHFPYHTVFTSAIQRAYARGVNSGKEQIQAEMKSLLGIEYT